LDKPHILALAAETGFLQFKEQVPLKFKKEISAVQCEREELSFDITFNPCYFSLDSPFKYLKSETNIKETQENTHSNLLTANYA
jgi:hypothetical protein